MSKTSNKNQARQEFLLTFFSPESRYEEKWVNGYWLVKHLVNSGPQCEVAIYSPIKFKAYKFLSQKWNEESTLPFSDMATKATPQPTQGMQDVPTQVVS